MATNVSTTINAWISAARLRTLPLSLSGIIVGSALGAKDANLDYSILQSSIFWLASLTTLGLQILSNFANDYGDGVKGTDNHQRIGPKRAIQSGIISYKSMKLGIAVTSLITLVLAVGLIYAAFKEHDFWYSMLFFALGIISIIAAIKYTVGNSAYGYKGLGDVFVFVFFGLLSVVGSYFLFTKELSFLQFLPAVTIGCLSTAVLNLNNLRDIKGDTLANKLTLAVKLGWQKGRIYHNLLGVFALLSFLIFVVFTYSSVWSLLPLGAFIPILYHYKTFKSLKEPVFLDPELKKVALSTFLFSVLFAIAAGM